MQAIQSSTLRPRPARPAPKANALPQCHFQTRLQTRLLHRRLLRLRPQAREGSQEARGHHRPRPRLRLRQRCEFLLRQAPRWRERRRTHRPNDRRLDDCLRYAIVAGKKALEDADLGADNRPKLDKLRAGVLVGSGMGGLTVFSDGVHALIEKGHRKITPFFIPYAITNMGSALLAIDLGLWDRIIQSQLLVLLQIIVSMLPANHIRRGEADLMIAGGTEAALIPVGLGGFVACRALSQRNDDPKTASRPWDKARDGFVMGEGAGVLVMESLEHATKRGAPIIASTWEVNYINAHATSTLAGDLAEINAIKKVFKNTKEIKINATKSMIGHCLGASGGLEAIATVKAIQTGWLHPSINQFNPEPSVEFDTVANVKQQHEVNVAISNSFGFGGHNSVVAFSAFKP
ncbi:hypothetical protein M0R45_013568 [Rubus argutus]|uniref:beta-ketoacyl-[acyl-carrier-protein] synthase I n=1 Tax=Rubus argutus TaxID=59490 RepID=A0AAW1XJI6_RUBAR